MAKQNELAWGSGPGGEVGDYFIIACFAGSRAEKYLQFIIENIGSDRDWLSLSGLMLAWLMIQRGAQRRAGYPRRDSAHQRQQRDRARCAPAGRSSPPAMPNARNILMSDLEKRIGELPAGRPIIVCCASGARSSRATSTLRRLGREQVFNLSGGIGAWQSAGLPTAK
ncbi:MAG: rhodanese-like domain-containing protein [Burkholderiaceae bacterium]